MSAHFMVVDGPCVLAVRWHHATDPCYGPFYQDPVTVPAGYRVEMHMVRTGGLFEMEDWLLPAYDT